MNGSLEFEVRPDRKGPKNIAVLLLLSSLVVAGMGWQDWQLHNEGLTDGQIETFLTTPNSQPGEPTTVEQYRFRSRCSRSQRLLDSQRFSHDRCCLSSRWCPHALSASANRCTSVHSRCVGGSDGGHHRKRGHQQRCAGTPR